MLNSHIRRNNKVVHIKAWEQKGIRWISDILYEEEVGGQLRFLTQDELQDMYNIKTDFLTYLGVIQSIPQPWRNTLKQHTEAASEEEHEDYKLVDQMMDSKQPTRLIYNAKIKNKSRSPEKQLERWKEDLGDISSEEILDNHFKQRKTIINQRLKSFNYMFMMRNVPYESRLYKMGLADTELCESCNKKETMKHLYWDCPNSSRLWERLKYLVEHHLHSPLTLMADKCMLGTGIWISKRHKERIWFLSVLTKHYIHLSKCNKTTRNIVGLENYIMSVMRMEKAIAIRRGTGNLYTSKWGDLMSKLEP